VAAIGDTSAAARPGSLPMGIAMAGVTAACGGLLPIITRYGAIHVEPLLFCSGATLVATVCALLLFRDGLGVLLDRRHRWRLVAISIAGTFLPSLAMVYGLRRVNAVSGVLLLQLEPVYSLAIATLVVGEAPSRRQVMATAIILLGIVSAFWGTKAIEFTYAALLVALTPLMWQVSHVFSLRVMPPVRPLGVTVARNVYAVVPLIALLMVRSPSATAELAHLNVVITLLATGAIVYFLGTLTWYGAISRLSLSWTTALVVPGSPVLALVFAALFLGERAGPRQIAAIVVAVAGILGLVLGSDPSRPHAAEMRAIEVPAPPGA
jgi:drug/metabolite transporter (DMT)-like permease